MKIVARDFYSARPLTILLMTLALMRTWASTNSVELPIKFHQHRVLVPAKVNSSGPHFFLLDSGYTITTLNPKIVDELQLEPSGRVIMNGIAGEEKAPTYRGVVFELQDLKYSPSRVASIPSERRRSRDGVFGYGFFRRFVVEMNSKTVRLHAPADFKYEGKGEIIPFDLKSEIPVVQGRVKLPNGELVSGGFEIDTGCDSGICLGKHFVEKHQLPGGSGAESSEKFGVGGSTQTLSGSLPGLILGKLEIKGPQTDFFLEGSPVSEPLAGHIGMGVFKDFKLILDYSRRQLILEKL